MGTQRMHQWRAPARGNFTGTRWPLYLDCDVALDPYLIWADSTAFLGFGGWDTTETQLDGQRLPLLLEFDQKGRSPGDTQEMGLLRIPAMYFESSEPGAALAYRHVTGLVHACEIERLLGCKHLLRFQLGAPRLPGVGEVAPAVSTPVVDRRRTVLGFIDHGCAFAHPQLADIEGRTRLHALWDQGRPQAGLPTRPADADGWWSEDLKLGYGMELRRQALKWATDFSGGQDDPCKAPLAAYEILDYVPQRLAWGQPATRRHAATMLRPPLEAMATGTHGTATMDLAMGLMAPMHRRLPGWNRTDRDTLSTDHETASWAAVFVQLPGSTVMDTTGGSLAFHVLDGLHYIVDRARHIGPDDDSNVDDQRSYINNKIVVTLGYGAMAGSHDGSSIIECAIDELVKRSPNRSLWVVLAAGNAHRSHSHASLRLRPGEPGQLVWSVPPDNPLESFLEVWIPTTDVLGMPLPNVAEHMLVEVKPPGTSPTRLTLGEWRTLQDEQESDAAPGCVAAAVFARRVAQTTLGATMVLLASAPTRRALPGEGPERSIGRSGDWTVTLTWTPQQDDQPAPTLEVHAWVERSDLVFGTRRGLQSRVRADAPDPLPTEAMPAARSAASGIHEAELRLYSAFTPMRGLSSLAGGAQERPNFGEKEGGNIGAVVTVGSYRLSDGEMSPDSSGGPDRRWSVDDVVAQLRHGAARHVRGRQQPDADAPGDVSPAVRGLPVAGTRAGAVDRLSATSAAAPTVARAIAVAQSAADARAFEDQALAAKAMYAAEVDASQRPTESPRIGYAHPARGTPHPTLDDRFRRGRWRAR